jgi:PTH1 family peptidyl-tRNA hydrolase
MKLLVGLGNPGAKYARNRHNVGFMAVDAIARAYGFGPWRKRFQAETAEGRIGDQACLLVKPTTFMNESGRAVGEAMRFYKLAPWDLIVFHDEIDLPPGKMRVKGGGSHAGHNGLRSLDAHIGPQFYRVRIGVGHPGSREHVAGYVLHDFAKADQEWLDPLLEAISDAMPELVQENDGRFMNQVSLAMQHALAKPEAKTAGNGKTKDKAARAKAPSQRDLSRAAAKREDEPPAPAEERSGEGPLAGMLRRWLGGGRKN